MSRSLDTDMPWDRLSPKEQKFIVNYIATGNATQSVLDAGYSVSRQEAYVVAKRLKNNPHIKKHIKAKLEEINTPMIADGKEVMEYLTAVMRGEVKDAFGLDCTVSERTRAAIELVKRTYDIDVLDKKDEKNINITLQWD